MDRESYKRNDQTKQSHKESITIILFIIVITIISNNEVLEPLNKSAEFVRSNFTDTLNFLVTFLY